MRGSHPTPTSAPTTPKYFTSPAPIQPNAKGTINTAMPTTKPAMLCKKAVEPWVPLRTRPPISPKAIIQFGILRTVKSKKTARTVTSKIEKSSGLSNLQRRYFIKFDRIWAQFFQPVRFRFCLGDKTRPFLAPKANA